MVGDLVIWKIVPCNSGLMKFQFNLPYLGYNAVLLSLKIRHCRPVVCDDSETGLQKSFTMIMTLWVMLQTINCHWINVNVGIFFDKSIIEQARSRKIEQARSRKIEQARSRKIEQARSLRCLPFHRKRNSDKMEHSVESPYLSIHQAYSNKLRCFGRRKKHLKSKR